MSSEASDLNSSPEHLPKAPVRETASSAANPQPAAATQQSGSNVSSGKINLKDPGYFLDGWADLVEGRGEKADAVYQQVLKEIGQRKPETFTLEKQMGSIGIGGGSRPYLLTATHPGAKTLIYIAQHGTDLYVSWRTFIRPVLHDVIPLITIIAFGLSAAAIYWASYSVVYSLVLGIIFTFLVLAALGVLGRLFKGNSAAYFFVEPNLFHADNITGMSLAAHKSIQKSMQTVGIQTDTLRLKRTFKGGRRGEEV